MTAYITHQPAAAKWRAYARISADDLFVTITVGDEDGGALTVRINAEQVKDLERAIRAHRAAQRRLRAV